MEYDVYNEGEQNLDPYRMVIDTTCPKMVTGQVWMDTYIESKGEKVEIIRKENESFRIGPSHIYTSEVCYEIEVEINNMEERIEVSVIEANILLLLGLEYQVKWGMTIDVGKQEIYIRKSGDRFKKEKETDHWTLPIQRQKQLTKETEKLVHTINTEVMQDWGLRKCIEKIYKIICHQSED